MVLLKDAGLYKRMWIKVKVQLLSIHAGCMLVCMCVCPRYHRVQSALTQQNSELQDTRMLTEFLERVELEESQELRGTPFGLGQVRS